MLVIIGLLIGGLFVGQSLIHNAQINGVIAEFTRYHTAVKSFQQQYQAIPGDMNNATSFWGSVGGTGSDTTCQNTVSTTAATCNGNGDGFVGTSVVASDEIARFWQHLANAKMVEGSFTGVAGGAWKAGTNMPASKYGDSTGWVAEESKDWPAGNVGSENWLAADYGSGNNLSTHANGATILPKDAWSIDKKLDDAKPGMGNVLAAFWATCTTAANQTDSTAAYKLTSTSPGCGLVFLTSF